MRLQRAHRHFLDCLACKGLAKDRLATLVDTAMRVGVPAQPTRMAARLLHSLRKIESTRIRKPLDS